VHDAEARASVADGAIAGEGEELGGAGLVTEDVLTALEAAGEVVAGLRLAGFA
jgi:hypothetical protein